MLFMPKLSTHFRRIRRGTVVASFAILASSPVTAETAKSECEAILNALQLPLEPYVFEKGGFSLVTNIALGRRLAPLDQMGA
jgi:hypothetical protein